MPSAPPSASPNIKQGIVFALAGFATLPLGDAIVKSMAGEFPAPGVAALRYLFGSLGLVILLWWREGRAGFRCPQPLIQLGRAVAVSISACCFFAGVQMMPLADMIAISLTSPMIVALLSAWWLKEPAPRAAWIAAAFGFAGTLLLLRPNVAAFGWAALLPLISATTFAVMLVFNRKAAGTGGALLMQVLISVLALPIMAVVALAGHLTELPALRLHWPDWTVLARCAMVAVTGSTAHGLLFLAAERASAAQTAPLVYVQLLVALVLGALFFGEWPDVVGLAGSGIIIAAGLYLWRSARAG